MRFIIVAMAMVAMVSADIYMHNPRGSNNRQDENGRERRNANRMFDSQNNNRGGYNKGERMYYYAGSVLDIEWTNQHQCGGDNSNCNLVIQWMCSEHARDGTITNTIPDHHSRCANRNCNTDARFGMHESNEYYQECKHTMYNRGLFTADQNLTGNSAQYTRQNPNAQRRGYECPEERDYYPYWRPSPWRDIAILTNDVSKCAEYKKNSENQKSKNKCFHKKLLKKIFSKTGNPNQKYPKIPITQVECERFEYEGEFGKWTDTPSHNEPLPDCKKAPESRDNHNGNGLGGQPNTYQWTIPNTPCEKAVLRIRYNISTDDYEGKKDFNANGRPAKTVNIGALVGLSNEEAHKRGYVFKNDPEVQPFAGDIGKKLKLAIALNTAQTGRTFQDRSHVFAIREGAPIRDCEKLVNLNVRGKRGNIVQVYPAVEYDFVPNTIEANVGACVHVQWTGSNNNPANNAGEGTRGTDRSNMVLLEGPAYNKDADFEQFGQSSRSYPMHLDNATFAGFSRFDMTLLAVLKDIKEGQKVNAQLNDAPPYFDLGVREFTRPGTFNYMCTRNNNFSNRSQKGRIVVSGKKRKDSKDENDENIQVSAKRSYHREVDNMRRNYLETGSLLER